MEVATSIDEIPASQLAAFGDVLFGAPFLSFVEAEHGDRAIPTYFSEQVSGAVVAFAPAYEYERPIPFTFRPHDFVEASALTDVLGAARRCLVVNVPYRLRSRVLAIEPRFQETLIDGIVGWAEEHGLGAVAFPFVLASDTQLCAALTSAGFVAAFNDGDFYLPLAGTDLDGFLGALDAGPRKQFRNDMNRIARSDLVIAELPSLAAVPHRLAELHKELMEKYRQPAPEMEARTFCRFEELITDRYAVGGWLKDELVGFALSTFDSRTFQLLRYGSAGDVDPRARLYSNLVFVRSVERALALGCERVHFGKNSHRAKRLRGCKFEEGLLFVRSLVPNGTDRLRTMLPAVDRSRRERFTRLLHDVR